MTFEEWYGVGWDTTVAADARDAWEAATLAACEACAKLCDDLYEPGDFWGDGKAFGNAIRERFNVLSDRLTEDKCKQVASVVARIGDEMEPHNYWSLKACADQLTACGFECEAGPLTMNDAFIWLKNAAIVGPEFLPGQGVFFEVEAEAAGKKLTQWVHFYIVGCCMDSDAEKRFWRYDLSYDPPAPYHYGTVHIRGTTGDRLRLQAP